MDQALHSLPLHSQLRHELAVANIASKPPRRRLIGTEIKGLRRGGPNRGRTVAGLHPRRRPEAKPRMAALGIWRPGSLLPPSLGLALVYPAGMGLSLPMDAMYTATGTPACVA